MNNHNDDVWNLVSDLSEPPPKRCSLFVSHYFDKQHQKRVSIRELPNPVRQHLMDAIRLMDTQEHCILQVFWNKSKAQIKSGIQPFMTYNLIEDYSFTIEYKSEKGLVVERRCINPGRAPDFLKADHEHNANSD
ncbi:hypothetical protein [Neptuniibacter halophilus]|uniref:hypothetical protein n=1 Tax=Neptuniibacter halophilus TaxID=651666 RepID=UPI00257337F3|nr:hypothetical protein [Neptuniibacter halophilus]